MKRYYFFGISGTDWSGIYNQLTNIYGSQGEKLQQTDFARHGDLCNVYVLRGGYSEGWTVFWITAHFLNAGARFMEMNVIP